MIKTSDVVRAVNTALKSAFADTNIMSTDKAKDVPPKSFYVEYPAPMVDGSNAFRHESGTIYVYYFPADVHKCRQELLQVQERLQEVFCNILEVTEQFAIPINELQFTENDSVLVMQFDYEMWQYAETTGTASNMEELVIKEG